MAAIERSVGCRVCNRADGKLIKPCSCTNELANVHLECLLEHMKSTGFEKCDQCNANYKGVKIHKKPSGFGLYLRQNRRWFGAFVQFPLVAGFVFYLIYIGFFQLMQSKGVLYRSWTIFLGTLVTFFALLYLAAFIGGIVVFYWNYKQWKLKNPHIITITEDTGGEKSTPKEKSTSIKGSKIAPKSSVQ